MTILRTSDGKILRSASGKILRRDIPVVTPIKYGLLYNWYAGSDVRNIASIGWHVPTYSNITTLLTYLGGSSVSGGKLKETGFTSWNTPNTGATNEFGFNARGSGDRVGGTGVFGYIQQIMTLWASTIYVEEHFGNCIDLANYGNISSNGIGAEFTRGKSIRPIKDSSTWTEGELYTDPSGYKYRTIKIGNQVWVADNIKTQHYRNGDAIPEVTDNTVWAALTTGALCAYNNDHSNV